MSNNYNKIAGFYDALSRIVFQNSIVEAQKFLIKFINQDNKVLIAGGGTGWILKEISQLNKRNIEVVYVEKSSAMIDLAKKINHKNIKVSFIHAAIENYNSIEQYDVIITPFLFDNFLTDKIEFVFAKLDAALKQNGIWLYADFINKANNTLWQNLLLKIMYLFFKLTAKIETQQLINMHPYFNKKYSLLSQQFYYRNFIQAVAYKKTAN